MRYTRVVVIGQTISHYKITDKLGEGGMGVVYKAEDTKLKRPVALKFLAAHLLKDEESSKRFEREAQAAAALHHPNVCPIHEIAEAEGQTFLAMAFIEGDSLDKRIEQGPLKIPEALDISRQIANGLQAAHEKGIAHRDIKPGNVIVDEKGHATVMDFGLALLTEGSKLTQLDTTVGTVAYMSPEQAQGAEVDHRTDLWALGCVVYEMVCAQRPFRGVYDQVLLYEIVNQEHEPLTGVRAGVPMELEWIAAKCLAKDQGKRYQSATDLIVDLETLQEKLKSGKSTILRGGMATQAVVTGQAGSRARTGVVQAGASAEAASGDRGLPEHQPPGGGQKASTARERLAWLLAAASLAAVLVLGFLHFGQSPAEQAAKVLRRFTVTPLLSMSQADVRVAAISPNGLYIALAMAGTEGRLWIQDLNQREPRVIEGTEAAFVPFWSPDSRFIAFRVGSELTKVPVRGGPASRICELPGSIFGGSWSPDGELIVFSSRADGSGPPMLYEVPARGGTPQVLVSAGEADASPEGPRGGIADPHFLPAGAGSHVLLFTFGSAFERTMMIQDLESGRREILGPGTLPVYAAGGYLVYQTSPSTHDLWALPFSLDTLQATGEAFPIAQGAQVPTVSADGTLVYVDGTGTEQEQLVWLDRRGGKTRELGRAQEFIVDLAVSPDVKRVAVSARESGNQDIWVYDAERAVKTRLTTKDNLDFRPVWSPAGDEILFAPVDVLDIVSRPADGSGEAKELLASADRDWVTDWSRDGRYILFARTDPENGPDLWYLERKPEGGWEPKPFLQTPFRERASKLSPDGRFIAYSSNESGQEEIHVQPFPEGGRKTTVSTNGGQQARWWPFRSRPAPIFPWARPPACSSMPT